MMQTRLTRTRHTTFLNTQRYLRHMLFFAASLPLTLVTNVVARAKLLCYAPFDETLNADVAGDSLRSACHD